MSQTVDNRVVEMRFDNQQFESNVQTSLSTLDKLKKSLDFSDSVDSFSDIDSAAKDVDMSGLSSAVETVHAKFSAMEVIAITALANITNSAIDAGVQLAKSLSIDQITAGWEKYADKTTAVQTIMSATASTWEENAEAIGYTGTQMEFVTDQLEKLNWFSDETSYSFTDMTSNIGKFTSNGVALTDAVQAMQGISTWAAKSGQSTTEASRAMYNLAQALSVGAVKLEDWKSIENANMATQEFKQTAINTAVELGTLKEVSDGVWETLNGSTVTLTDFNSALTEDKWFNSDVLMATLNEYGAASVRLSEICDEYGTTASQFLSGMDDYQKGTKTVNDIASDMGISAKELIPLFEELSGEEYELGLASFKAAQEAKTFSEAIDATKDAVSTGWMTTFDTIFGNYEEAKILWTDLANALWDVFAASGEVRNGILAVWKDEGGRDDLIEAFWNLWEAVSAVVTPVKEAFNEIFHGVTDTTAEEYIDSAGIKLANITKTIKEFTEKLKINDETADKIKRTYKGFYAALDIVKQAISAVVGGIKPLLSVLPGMGDGILGVTGNIGDWIVKLDEYLKENEIFKKGVQEVVNFVQGIPDKLNEVFKSITGISIDEALMIVKDKLSYAVSEIQTKFNEFIDFIKTVPDKVNSAIESFTGMSISDIFDSISEKLTGAFDKIKEVFTGFKEIDTSGMDSFADRVKTRLEPLGTLFDGIKSIFSGIWEFIKKLSPVFAAIASIIGQALSGIGNAISTGVGNINFNGLADIVNSGVLIAIAVGIKNFMDSLSGITENAGGMLESLKDILDGAKGCFEAWQKDIQANTLLKIAGAVAILSASLIALSLVDSVQLATALAIMGGEFTELITAMKSLEKIFDDSDGDTLKSVGTTMLLMSAAILVLSMACTKLAQLDWDGVFKGVTGIGALSGIMVIAMEKLQAASDKYKDGSIKGLISFAIAIGLLTISLKSIAKLNPDELEIGLLGMAGLATIMSATIIALQAASNKYKDGSISGLISFSVAMGILTISLKSIAKLNQNELTIGLNGMAGLAIIMGTTIIALQAASSKYKEGSISGLISFAVAMGVLTFSLKSISELTFEQLTIGLAGMIGLAAIMDTAIIALQLASSKYKEGSIGGLISFAVAMGILTLSLKSISELNFTELITGLAGIAGLAVIMSGTLIALSAASSAFGSINMVGIAASMLLMATSILVLTPALKALGNMSLAEIGKALLVLAGAFAVIGVAGAVLSPLVPAILGLSAAVALLGVGVLACGAGLLAFSAGLTALAAAGGAAIEILITVFKSLIKLIPDVAVSLTEGLLSMIQELGNAAPTIATAVIQIITSVVQLLTECVPQIIACVMTLLVELLAAIDDNAPAILASVFGILFDLLEAIRDNIGEIVPIVVDIILEVLDSIAEKIPDIIQAGIDIVIGLIDGLSQGLVENAPRIRDALINLGKSLLEAFLEFFGIHSPSTVFAEIGNNLIQGLIDGVGAMLSSAVSAVIGVATGMLTAIKNKMGDFLAKGKELMTNLKTGIGNKLAEVKAKTTEVVTGALTMVKNKLVSFKTKGQELMTNLKTGIGNKLSEVKAKTTEVVSSALDGIRDKLSEFTEVGSNLIKGLKKGIENAASEVVSAAKGVVSNAISAAKNLLGINSPSKVFAEIGRYTDEGLVQGLKAYSSKVSDASEDVGQEAIDGMNGAISKITEAINSNMDLQPTIRPVLDLTDVTNGANRINNLLNSSQTSLNLAGIANSEMSRLYGENQNEVVIDNNNVVEAINTLRDDVSSLASVIGNMKMVLDTGTLVGSLTTPLDKSLGRQQVYRGRGI